MFPNVAHAARAVGAVRAPTGSSPPSSRTTHEAQGAAIAAKRLVRVEPRCRAASACGRDARRRTTPGTLTPVEYRALVADLVNYLDYMGEPAKNKRISLGIVVLLYLGVLFVFAYWLKREYWKDVH